MRQYQDDIIRLEISSNQLPLKNLALATVNENIPSPLIDFTETFKPVESLHISRILLFERIIYSLTPAQHDLYTLTNINLLKQSITPLLSFDSQGFIDLPSFKSSLFLKTVYTLYPTLRNIDLMKPGSGFRLLNLTHCYNLFLLIMIKEICILDKVLPEEDRVEGFYDLLEYKTSLLARLSPSLRSVLSLNRYNLQERIYCGFDTEYQNVDLGVNDLLVSTQSIYPKLYLLIKKLSTTADIH